MKQETGNRRWPNHVVPVAGGGLAVLGLAVLLSWYTQQGQPLQPSSAFVPMSLQLPLGLLILVLGLLVASLISMTVYLSQKDRLRAREAAEGNEKLQRQIAERHQAAQALEQLQSESKYRTLIETTNTGFLIVDMEGKVLDANAEYVRLSGHADLKDIAGRRVVEWTAAHDLERNGEAIKRCGCQGFVRNLEIDYVNREGAIIPVEINATLIQTDQGPRILSLCRDITERKRVKESLRASEARYQSLVENLTQSVFMKDRELRFVAVNKPFCRDLGRPAEEVIGKTDFDFYPRYLADKYRGDDRLVLNEGRRLELEEENPLADGKLRTVRVVKTAVRDDQGQIVGVLGIFWDVTEQRSLEAQLRQAQKMEAVGQLAGGVAHDFNNLLTAILGNVSLVLAGLPADDPKRELAEAAEKAAWRAANLTSQLLGFSRQTILRPQPTNLNNTIDEIFRILRRTIDPRIRLEVRGEPELWPVQIDPAQMNQVLMNLCLNARDAMPEGGDLLLETGNLVLDEDYARVHLEARAGEHVRLTVRDTGQGIPPEIRPRIFEPFFTTKGPGKGTGLGLAVVYGIVKQHGGWVECYSELHRGTRFDIYLPRHPGGKAAGMVSVAASNPAGGTETILLVDDEPLIRDLGRTILERYGYQVLVAEDGLQAVEVYERRKDQIRLIILDLTMPRLSGRDAYYRLRQMDPEVRVLISSGYSDAQVSPADDGVLGFIGKPFRPEDLAQKVRSALDQYRSSARTGLAS